MVESDYFLLHIARGKSCILVGLKTDFLKLRFKSRNLKRSSLVRNLLIRLRFNYIMVSDYILVQFSAFLCGIKSTVQRPCSLVGSCMDLSKLQLQESGPSSTNILIVLLSLPLLVQSARWWTDLRILQRYVSMDIQLSMVASSDKWLSPHTPVMHLIVVVTILLYHWS